MVAVTRWTSAWQNKEFPTDIENEDNGIEQLSPFPVTGWNSQSLYEDAKVHFDHPDEEEVLDEQMEQTPLRIQTMQLRTPKNRLADVQQKMQMNPNEKKYVKRAAVATEDDVDLEYSNYDQKVPFIPVPFQSNQASNFQTDRGSDDTNPHLLSSYFGKSRPTTHLPMKNSLGTDHESSRLHDGANPHLISSSLGKSRPTTHLPLWNAPVYDQEGLNPYLRAKYRPRYPEPLNTFLNNGYGSPIISIPNYESMSFANIYPPRKDFYNFFAPNAGISRAPFKNLNSQFSESEGHRFSVSPPRRYFGRRPSSIKRCLYPSPAYHRRGPQMICPPTNNCAENQSFSPCHPKVVRKVPCYYSFC